LEKKESGTAAGCSAGWRERGRETQIAPTRLTQEVDNGEIKERLKNYQEGTWNWGKTQRKVTANTNKDSSHKISPKRHPWGLNL